ncbi:MAG: polyphosphate kinase 1 [Candidatus Competibacteraceae bacterium]|nr:polyphosphate kinase 1 [Candidatus Competibacteraceae bacterium]
MSRYINRDISWLSFNYRVLEESFDDSLPLYERIKFMAIYSANLDEFFRVRVGAIRNDPSSTRPGTKNSQILSQILFIVSRQQREFGKQFREKIIPELESHGIYLLNEKTLSPTQYTFVRNYFLEELIFHVQPVLLVKNKVAPFLQNGAIYFVVSLQSQSTKKIASLKPRLRYAIVKIPSDIHSRFIELPPEHGKYGILFLDDVIRVNLNQLFRGYDIKDCYSIKLSRDADLHIEDEYEGSIIEKVKRNLSKRKTGATSRFLYDEKMPDNMLDFLKECFRLKKNELVQGGKYHNFFDLFKFPNPISPQLEVTIPQPMRIPELDSYPSIFEAIKTRDWLLNFPYQRYEYFLRFLQDAALDPKVIEIKATQYRVADNSAVVEALINAARNGKKVTVFVEVKARFDEEANMKSAQQMASAGIKIIYSIPGLKVHAKACLISRISGNIRGIRHYAFMSTGNFNEKTAKIYCDHALFTSNPDLTDELIALFDYLESQQKQVSFRKLWIAQFNMVSDITSLIESEIKNAKNGYTAKLLIKLNNLEDPYMIDLIYKAGRAGVKVDIIVRSICCLIPDALFSENITVRRIVDTFLEHARIFVFYHGGKNLVFMSSADWMRRNLYHRIELGFPILDEDIKSEILEILAFQLADNQKARILDQELINLPIQMSAFDKPIRAQQSIYTYLRDKYFKIFDDA